MSPPSKETCINTLRPRQNGRHFPDDTFKRIFLNDNVRISIKISLKIVPKGPIINIPVLVQIMAWHRPGNKPLSEPMMVSLLTHICLTRPQWVNKTSYKISSVSSCTDLSWFSKCLAKLWYQANYKLIYVFYEIYLATSDPKRWPNHNFDQMK